MVEPYETTSLNRLLNEIGELILCEKQYDLPALPIIKHLITDFLRPNGPEPPLLDVVKFNWPVSEKLDFTDYWKKHDKERR